jgi:diguanylate cyclase (GGDEF)-like protein
MAMRPERMWLQDMGLGADRLRDQIARLTAENQALRRENSDLLVYRRLAYRDPLTGLGNRRYLKERLSEERVRARRHPSQCFSVLAVDLDGFKQINDEHGHGAGDDALRFVARFFVSHLREHDICCRVGGDEFTIILPETDGVGARELRARLLLLLAEANKKLSIALGLSIGVATWPSDGDDVDALLNAADFDMFRVKTTRRGPSSRSLAIHPKAVPAELS